MPEKIPKGVHARQRVSREPPLFSGLVAFLGVLFQLFENEGKDGSQKVKDGGFFPVKREVGGRGGEKRGLNNPISNTHTLSHALFFEGKEGRRTE